VLRGSAARVDAGTQAGSAGRVKETPMGSRTNRAHDAKARAREARAVMLAERQAQDERIERAVADTLLAIEDKAAALAQAEQEERTLAAALQRLGREAVSVRDIVAMTGLTETHVTRLLRTKLDAKATAEATAGAGVDRAAD
jgi:hypothetical protein